MHARCPGSLDLPLFSLAALAALTAGCRAPEPTYAVAPARSTGSPAPSASASAPGAALASRALSPKAAGASPVTFARIARFPEPGWRVPSRFSFRAGPTKLTYLASETGDDVLSLFELDHGTGASRVLLRAQELLGQKKTGALSKEEELRRERQRLRTKGITSYVVAKTGGRIVVPLGGDVHLREPGGAVRAVTHTPEAEIDPKLCDDGSRVGYVRGAELYVTDLATGKESAVSARAGLAKPHVTRGQSDYNAQEEFGETSGWWFSPDCRSVAYLEVDDSAVEEILVPGFRQGEASHDPQRYPRPGKANPKVKVVVASLAGGAPRAVPLPDLDGHYLVGFSWEPSSAGLSFQALPRDQRSRAFVRVDARTLAHTTRELERSPRYVEARPIERLEGSAGFFTLATHEGHAHLELRDGAGVLERTVTHGPWDVTEIAAIDEKAREVFFVATKESPLERHLYAVSYEPGAGFAEPRRLTREAGFHAPVVDARSGKWIDVHSARDRPPAVQLRGAKGELVRDLTPAPDPEIAALRVRPTEPLKVVTRDGTTLHGHLLRPRDLDPTRLYPVVVMVYGGPGVQAVVNRWSPKLLWQHLADRGFFVAQLDNRGSTGRGVEFASATYGKLGDLELQDQLEGLEALKALPGVDPTRVGIYGVSYGGTMTLQAMLRALGKFKAGVAEAAVVDWSYYDSAYTERYLGPWSPGAASYADTELSRHVGALTGRLLVMHGLMDENVHFANTAKLVDALVAAQKPFDLFVFPDKRHGTRAPTAKEWSSRKVTEFFVETLR
ncbi:MAG TPA: alpha/beta fold hydrolase [Polyangiaceae bacterium]|nr:alpha/beta fold hydrolase [Polyangiaceae bacterium]